MFWKNLDVLEWFQNLDRVFLMILQKLFFLCSEDFLWFFLFMIYVFGLWYKKFGKLKEHFLASFSQRHNTS